MSASIKRTAMATLATAVTVALIGQMPAQSATTITYTSTLGISGEAGTDNAHFNDPHGVAVDAAGNVYVADHNNNRIQKFSPDGTYQATFSGPPSNDNTHLSAPFGVAVDGSGNVWVADFSNIRVQEFDAAGNYESTLGTTRATGTDNSHFDGPRGVGVDTAGNVYVADSNNNRVQKFSSSGMWLKTFGTTAVDGTDNSHFSFPTGVAVDATGNVYVADTFNNRVQKFNAEGSYIATIGTTGVEGTDNSHLNKPNGVAVDADGNLYVADTFNNRVQKFDSSGNYLASLGTHYDVNDINSYFQSPTGVAVDATGAIYVADSGHHRIQKFTQTTIDDQSPPTVSLTAPTARWELASSTAVKWSASDSGGSGLAKFQVRYRRAPYNSGFGAWTYPSTWQAKSASATQVTAGLSAGYTYCFSVRAFDQAGNISAWSAQRCTRSPLDDRSLTPASGWTQSTSSTAYKGTLMQATTVGSQLTRTNSQVARVALVATKCPTCGTVTVKAGSTTIGTVNLYASTTKAQQLITLPTFTLQTTTIAVVVTSTGKPVIIDGLGISRM